METVYNSDLFKLSYTTIMEHCLTIEDGAVFSAMDDVRIHF